MDAVDGDHQSLVAVEPSENAFHPIESTAPDPHPLSDSQEGMCCAWDVVRKELDKAEAELGDLVLKAQETLRALNLNATFMNAVILQSTVLTVRNVAFAIPSGLGVQEGGYVLIGSLLGIDGTTALALSLIARVRELALGIPGIISWQLIEGRRLLRARTVDAAS